MYYPSLSDFTTSNGDSTISTGTYGSWGYRNTTITDISSAIWTGWDGGIQSDRIYIQQQTVYQQRVQELQQRIERRSGFSQLNECARRQRERAIFGGEDPTYTKPKEDAEAKAVNLLLELIGEKELEVYNRTGRILVHGKKCDYLIKRNGDVRKIEKKKMIDLCIAIESRYSYPNTDNVIALKLLIEGNEKKFANIANKITEYDREELPECACA